MTEPMEVVWRPAWDGDRRKFVFVNCPACDAEFWGVSDAPGRVQCPCGLFFRMVPGGDSEITQHKEPDFCHYADPGELSTPTHFDADDLERLGQKSYTAEARFACAARRSLRQMPVCRVSGHVVGVQYEYDSLTLSYAPRLRCRLCYWRKRVWETALPECACSKASPTDQHPNTAPTGPA
jgi:ribosomal protein S27E